MSRGTLEFMIFGVVCSVAVLMIPVEQTVAATKKEKESAPIVIAAKITKQSQEQGQNPSIQNAKKSSIAAPPDRQPEVIKKQAKSASAEPKPTSQKSPMSVARERAPEVIEKQANPVSTEPKPVSPKSFLPVATERQPEAFQRQAKPVQADLKLTRSKNPRHMKVHKKEMPKAVVEPSIDLMYHGMLESPQRYDPRRNHRVGAGTPDPHNPELTHDHFQELDRNQDGSIDPVERVLGRLDMDRDLYDRRPR
jgi:hypothetical protein